MYEVELVHTHVPTLRTVEGVWQPDFWQKSGPPSGRRMLFLTQYQLVLATKNSHGYNN